MFVHGNVKHEEELDFISGRGVKLMDIREVLMQLRGCADRDVMRPCGKRARDARSFGELPSFPNDKERIPVPAIPPYIIEPIWEQFTALLPEREVHHPLGCHRSRIPDRVIFEKLVQVLVFGCAYRRIADGSCSATTL